MSAGAPCAIVYALRPTTPTEAAVPLTTDERIELLETELAQIKKQRTVHDWIVAIWLMLISSTGIGWALIQGQVEDSRSRISESTLDALKAHKASIESHDVTLAAHQRAIEELGADVARSWKWPK